MKQTLISALCFAAGAAVGSLITWKLIDSKYRRMAQEEVDSVKEAFTRMNGVDFQHEHISYANDTDTDECPGVVLKKHARRERPQTDYTAFFNGISTAKNNEENAVAEPHTPVEKGGGEPEVVRPYVIHPNELDTIDDYETEGLTYFADHILADDQGFIIEDVDGMVGFESLNHFGDFGEDSVCVRNDARKTDYEILLDPSTYTQAYPNGPRMVGT